MNISMFWFYKYCQAQRRTHWIESMLPKSKVHSEDLPSPAEGCSICKIFWFRRCCWFMGNAIGREFRRLGLTDCGRLLVAFCAKWFGCSGPGNGKELPIGWWLCIGAPEAVVTITPSWRTDVVFVMAGWPVPAIATDDIGNEPPKKHKHKVRVDIYWFHVTQYLHAMEAT